MEETTSIRDEIKKLNDNFQQLIEQKKVKKWKLPFKGKLNKQKTKQNYTTICYINDNREVSFLKAPIIEGVLEVEGCPRIATADYMLSYKGKPLIIQPSWSVKPFSPVDNYEQTVKERMASAGYRLLMNKIETEGIKKKKKLSGAVIFIILIALIVIGYLALGGKK